METLAPTYQLTVGLPGRSNALAIATRLGMQPDLVEAARRYLDPHEIRVENLLGSIQQEREGLAEERVQAERARRDLEEQNRELQRHLRNMDQLKREAVADARAGAEAELSELRELLKRVRTETTSATLTREWAEQQSQRLEDAQRDLRSRNRRRTPPSSAAAPPGVPAPPLQEKRPLRPGDRVRVPAFDTEGEVLTVPDADGMVEVQLGIFKMRLAAADLERLPGRRDGGDGWSLVSTDEEEPAPPRPAGARAWQTEEAPRRRTTERSAASVLQRAAQAAPSLEFDIRGWRAEEMEPPLDQYLQDAALAGMPMVRIIHGKGTGVLRDVVRTILAATPSCAAGSPPPSSKAAKEPPSPSSTPNADEQAEQPIVPAVTLS